MYGSSTSSCPRCHRFRQMAAWALLVRVSSSTASRQASAFASAVGRAARAPAAFSAPVIEVSRCFLGRDPRLVDHPEPGEVVDQQPAEVGVDRQPVRHPAADEPVGEQIRAPARIGCAGEGSGQRELKVRAGRRRRQEIVQTLSPAAGHLGPMGHRRVAERRDPRLAEQGAHGGRSRLARHAAEHQIDVVTGRQLGIAAGIPQRPPDDRPAQGALDGRQLGEQGRRAIAGPSGPWRRSGRRR